MAKLWGLRTKVVCNTPDNTKISPILSYSNPEIDFNKISLDDIKHPIGWSPEFFMRSRLNNAETDSDRRAILPIFAKLIAELEIEGRVLPPAELKKVIECKLKQYLETVDPQVTESDTQNFYSVLKTLGLIMIDQPKLATELGSSIQNNLYQRSNWFVELIRRIYNKLMNNKETRLEKKLKDINSICSETVKKEYHIVEDQKDLNTVLLTKIRSDFAISNDETAEKSQIGESSSCT